MIAKVKKALALASLIVLGSAAALAGSYTGSWSSGNGFYQVNDSVTLTAAGSASMDIDSNDSSSFLWFQGLGQVSANGNPALSRSGSVAAGTYSIFGMLGKSSWNTPTNASLNISW